MKRYTAILMSLALSLCLAGCDKSKEFAKSLDRVAGYVDTGLQLVDRQTTAGQWSKDTGITIVTGLRAVNTINGQLIAEAKKYKSADGQRLELTGDGKTKLLQIVGSNKKVATDLLNNPSFLSIPADKRKEITLLISDLSNAINAVAELISAIQPTK